MVQIFFVFTSTWGNDPIWLIFVKWVVQPPARHFLSTEFQSTSLLYPAICFRGHTDRSALRRCTRDTRVTWIDTKRKSLWVRVILLMVQKSGQPVDMVNIRLITRFYTSKVAVWDFFHQQYEWVFCPLHPQKTNKDPTKKTWWFPIGISFCRGPPFSGANC